MTRIIVHVHRVELRNARGTDAADFSDALRRALAEQLAQTGGRALSGAASLEVVRTRSLVPHSPTASQLATATAGSVVGAVYGGSTARVGA